jgi:hypothetical protein
MQSREHRGREANSDTSQAPPLTPSWAALVPASVVALGDAEQPVERLLPLQSAISQAVHLVTAIGQWRPRLRLSSLPNLRLRQAAPAQAIPHGQPFRRPRS